MSTLAGQYSLLPPSSLQAVATSYRRRTLNVSLALTLSASTSATALSKFARIFMASWGSMRRSVIRLSSVSVRAPPRLSAVSPRAPCHSPRGARSTCFGGRARST